MLDENHGGCHYCRLEKGDGQKGGRKGGSGAERMEKGKSERRMKRKGERQEGEGCRERIKQRIEGEMKKGKGRRRKTQKGKERREREGTLLETDNRFRDIVKNTFCLHGYRVANSANSKCNSFTIP